MDASTATTPSGPTTRPVRVGLVGAGPWAEVFHAPMLASSSHTDLVGVWARRPEAAEQLASAHGAVAVRDIDELFATCEVVAFSVPPDVQADLAVRAADEGRHLLLEKPLGLTLEQASSVARAVEANGVISQLVLTWRYLPVVRAFLADAVTFVSYGARAASISGEAAEGGYFSTPWRRQHGALLDVGPHVLDLLDAAVGPIVDASMVGDPRRWVELTCRHESDAVSQASLSITTPVGASRWGCELYGPTGALVLEPPDDPAQTAREFASATRTVAEELAITVRTGTPHPLDAARGLHLQRLLERATAASA